MNRILIFGAGKIGRSFIGQLFSQGGFEVVFVDADAALVDALNRQGYYPVIIKSEKEGETLIIRNVRAIHLDEIDAVIEAFLHTNYIATAVGKANLPAVVPLIARGVRARLEAGNTRPVDIIIAENLRNAADYFREQLRNYLPGQEMMKRIGLVETSIGKMVPIMRRADLEKDITQVFAEPYNTLILDGKGFLNPLPDIKGLAPKDNMKAWVDRKSFIHNLGHAATVYYGHLLHPEDAYLYQLLSDERVVQFARSAMQQSGKILQHIYPEEFTRHDLDGHIEDLLYRFSNRALGDTVYRVGMDLNRKLNKEDRLAGAIHLGLYHQMPCDKILYALMCGMYFSATDENGDMFPGDVTFALTRKEKGYRYVLENLCGFDPALHQEVFILSENYNIELLNQENPKHS